jgi:hypothetical protein
MAGGMAPSGRGARTRGAGAGVPGLGGKGCCGEGGSAGPGPRAGAEGASCSSRRTGPRGPAAWRAVPPQKTGGPARCARPGGREGASRLAARRAARGRRGRSRAAAHVRCSRRIVSMRLCCSGVKPFMHLSSV